MSRHLSVATVIEKNKIASDKAFLFLFEIEIKDDFGAHVETLRLVRNSENLVWREETYNAANFGIDLKMDLDTEPSLTLNADDPTGYIREKMEEFGGGVGFDCTMIILNTGNMDQPPEIEESFVVNGSSAENYNVSFTLGVPNPLGIRFPRMTQMRDQCPYVFKGIDCQYAGAATSCSYTFGGANGCLSKNNSRNFGGFRGLQNLN